MDNNAQTFLNSSYQFFLSDRARHAGERWIMLIAIAGFLIHLLLIGLVHMGWLALSQPSELLSSPIAAIYTPFSFILIYEVYLLIFYIPKSTSSYIGKQYEIITLIVVRKIFKDLANLTLSEDWFLIPEDRQFTIDILGTLILFGLIFLFYRLNQARSQEAVNSLVSDRLKRYIRIKQIISLLLVPMLIFLAIYSLTNWIIDSFFSLSEIVEGITNVNKVFFDEFFMILVITDVFLLLVSLIYTDDFSTVIRNSGFIISTILIKISFATDGLVNLLLIVGAVAFGVLIFWIFTRFEKNGMTRKADHPE